MADDRIYGGLGGVVARGLDAAVGLVFPGWESKRIAARAAVKVMLGFDAAKKERTRRQRPRVESADDDLLPDLPEMRSNSRTMVRDDPNAASMFSTYIENIVGTGMIPQAIVAAGEDTRFTKEQAGAWNKGVEKRFRRWAKREADATAHSSFNALQQQALGNLVRDGEFLCHRGAINKPGRKTRSAIEFIDVDRLVDPRGPLRADTRGGIKVDEWSAPVGYWIAPRHPSESGRPGLTSAQRANEPVLYQKMDGDLPSILHGFRRTRDGQRRGVPLFSSSYGFLEALNDIAASESVASRVAAKICVLITQTKPLGMTPPGQSQQDDGQWVQKLESGTMPRLRPGEDVKPFVPQRPGTDWEKFCLPLLRSICSSWGLPYELVARDFASMNYSSARVALMEARRTFELWQQLLIEQFCQPWWEIVITEGVVSGELPLPPLWDSDRDAYFEALWVPPTWGYVDPAVEIEASRSAVEANVSTPQIEAARNGQDVEQVLRSKARFLQLAREIEDEFELEEGELTRERAERIESVQTEKAAGDETQKDVGAEPVGENEGATPGDQPVSENPEGD